jgi:hypothetical protein
MDPGETRIAELIASSKPAPAPIEHEVHDAIDRLAGIFRIDKALTEALKDELGIRLLTGESPDLFVYGPNRRPQRQILLNYLEEGGICRVSPEAVHEECAHAIRSIFHPVEPPMLQEFIGALGPILALNGRRMSGGPMLDFADTLFEMRQGGGHFTGIPDALAEKLRKFLPPTAVRDAGPGTENDQVARGFLEHSITHLIPMIAAESMADTGYLPELMERCLLIQLPPKEIAAILTEYGRRCAMDPDWKEKFKGYRNICGYYLKPTY